MDRVTTKCNTDSLDPFVTEGLTEEQFIRRCRAVALSDALQKTVEAIGHDKRCEDVHVTNHLSLAKDALLDALSQIAEREGA
jgi:hypothetical protein